MVWPVLMEAFVFAMLGGVDFDVSFHVIQRLLAVAMEDVAPSENVFAILVLVGPIVKPCAAIQVFVRIISAFVTLALLELIAN